MDPWFHGEEIIGFLERNWGESVLILVPRDHGKSTTITVPLPAYWVATDPFTSVIVANATEDKAFQMSRASAAIISDNEMFKSTFPDIRPSIKWSNKGYYIDASQLERGQGSVERIDAGIQPYGIRGNITGAHPDGGLICDDLINEKTAKSEIEVERARLFFKEAITCLSGNRPCVAIGTRWSYKDFYGDILEGKIVGPKGPFKVLKLGATKTNSSGEEELVWPRRTFIDHRGKVKEAGFTLERLENERINRGPLFSSLFYNEPIEYGNSYFNIKNVEAKIFAELPFKLGPVQSVCIEQESQAAALISTLSMIMRERGRTIRLEGVNARKKAKEERIKSWLGSLIESMRFNVRDVVWATQKGIKQELERFPKGHDDIIDAVAYLAELCPDTEEGQSPYVTIMCDPAFTENRKSDYTAIVAGCKYRGELYLLDVSHFQTDKAEVLLRMLLQMFDLYNEPGKRRSRRKKKHFGFSSERARAGIASRSRDDLDFEVDIDSFLNQETTERHGN